MAGRLWPIASGSWPRVRKWHHCREWRTSACRGIDESVSATSHTRSAVFRVLDYLFHNEPLNETMLFSKEYVGYLARELTKKLIAGEFIETQNPAAVTERVHAALLEEMSLEDRINDEVRVILEAYSDEMRRSGANYQEMFRKVKSELVKKYKAVL